MADFKVEFSYNAPETMAKVILGEHLFLATSRVRGKDQFSKVVGRKKALANLFKKHGEVFPRELRREIWQSLWSNGMKRDQSDSLRVLLKQALYYLDDNNLVAKDNHSRRSVASRIRKIVWW